ncbi:unnamed protein product [Cuscuta campestris]|uniref:Uncharacterized protein n=1 Tax=Cuscuta campestris TaxID=132261 RepID=A0A484KMB7_9ASTE|nr:unnamed protein product [Cuscuta campestris]
MTGFNNATVRPFARAAFPYLFGVSNFLQPGTFDLVGSIVYEVDQLTYQSTFYNGTIEVTEPSGLLSVESVFLFSLGVAIVGLLGFWIRDRFQNLSKKSKRPLKAKVEVGTGTTDAAMDEWLEGTAYSQSHSKSKKKQSLKTDPLYISEVVVASRHAATMKSLITSLLGLLLLLHGLSYAAADVIDTSSAVQVVGFGECADCKDHNIDPSHAFSELRVRIDCKLQNGEMKTRSSEAGAALDGDGKFRVWLPKEMVVVSGEGGGRTKEECYAQLHHAASASPCPAHQGIEASKIVVRTKPDGQRVLEPAAGKVKFSAAICTSAFLKIYKKPFFKKPLPHLPSVPIYKPKPKPPIYIPHVPIYKPKPKVLFSSPPPPYYEPKQKSPVYVPHTKEP